MMRKGCVGAALMGAGVLAIAACGSGGSGTTATATFRPGGTMAGVGSPTTPGAASGDSVTMPPFGKNVHITMTSSLPPNATEARAVLTDKDYELAYLYAEYTGGQDQSWTAYVSPTMQTEVQTTLSQASITTESFTGKIRFFDMTAVPDPTVKGDLDVSACFDNSQSSNTNLQTGKVIPDNVPADQHFYRYTDQLAKDSTGTWKVISDLPPVYYPRAKECKP
jgi:hypothetical protein